ncbi:MAG: DUF4307 domain-containing protein [Dermatophilaceae bacterium]
MPKPLEVLVPLPRPAPGSGRWWALGAFGTTVVLGVAIWWAATSAAGGVRPTVTRYDVESDSSIVVEYDLARPDGVAVVCRVNALDGSRGRVGTVEDAVPAAGPAAVRRTVRVRTSTRAVTGVVDSCTRLRPATP